MAAEIYPAQVALCGIISDAEQSMKINTTVIL